MGAEEALTNGLLQFCIFKFVLKSAFTYLSIM